MLAMIINSLKLTYSVLKNLIKPTYLGRQDTLSIPLENLLYFTKMKELIDLTSFKIIGIIINMVGRRNLERPKDHSMSTL